MFNFVSKFKNEVISGFDLVHQRLVTLEAKVEALFQHTQTVAEQAAKTAEAPVEAEVHAVQAATSDIATAAEAVKNAE